MCFGLGIVFLSPVSVVIASCGYRCLNLSELYLVRSTNGSLTRRMNGVTICAFSGPMGIIVFANSNKGNKSNFITTECLLGENCSISVCVLGSGVRSGSTGAGLRVLRGVGPHLSHLGVFGLGALSSVGGYRITGDKGYRFVVISNLLKAKVGKRLRAGVGETVRMVGRSGNIGVDISIPSKVSPLANGISSLTIIPSCAVDFRGVGANMEGTRRRVINNLMATSVKVPFRTRCFIGCNSFLELGGEGSGSRGKGGNHLLVIKKSTSCSKTPTVTKVTTVNTNMSLICIMTPRGTTRTVGTASPSLVIGSLSNSGLSLSGTRSVVRLSRGISTMLLKPKTKVSSSALGLFGLLITGVGGPVILSTSTLGRIRVSLVGGHRSVVLAPRVFRFGSFFGIGGSLGLSVSSCSFGGISRGVARFRRVAHRVGNSIIIGKRCSLVLSKAGFGVGGDNGPKVAINNAKSTLSKVTIDLFTRKLGTFSDTTLTIFVGNLTKSGTFSRGKGKFSTASLMSFVNGIVGSKLYWEGFRGSSGRVRD